MLNPWLGRGVCLAVGCVIGWFAQKSQVRARGWSRLPVSPAQPLPPALRRVAAAAAADQASHCRAASNLKTVPGYLPTHYCLPQHEGEDEYDSDDSEEGQQQPVGRRGRRSAGFAAPAPAEELKMVLVVNDELKMGKGKIGGRRGGARWRANLVHCSCHHVAASVGCPPAATSAAASSLATALSSLPACLLSRPFARRRTVRARGCGSGGAAARCAAGCGAGAVGALRTAQDLPQGQLHPGESASQ